jgi:hypothetical protein
VWHKILLRSAIESGWLQREPAVFGIIDDQERARNVVRRPELGGAWGGVGAFIEGIGVVWFAYFSRLNQVRANIKAVFYALCKMEKTLLFS